MVQFRISHCNQPRSRLTSEVAPMSYLGARPFEERLIKAISWMHTAPMCSLLARLNSLWTFMPKSAEMIMILGRVHLVVYAVASDVGDSSQSKPCPNYTEALLKCADLMTTSSSSIAGWKFVIKQKRRNGHQGHRRPCWTSLLLASHRHPRAVNSGSM